MKNTRDWLPDDDIEYIEKLRQNKNFKFCRVFMIHNFEAYCSQNTRKMFFNDLTQIHYGFE